MRRKRAKIRVIRYGSHKNKMTKIFIGISLILLLVILGLVFKEYFYKKIFKENKTERFVINDECSVFMDNIIHQIKDDADCNIKCRAECLVRKKEPINHTFKSNFSGPCFSCECYCR